MALPVLSRSVKLATKERYNSLQIVICCVCIYRIAQFTGAQRPCDVCVCLAIARYGHRHSINRTGRMHFNGWSIANQLPAYGYYSVSCDFEHRHDQWDRLCVFNCSIYNARHAARRHTPRIGIAIEEGAIALCIIIWYLGKSTRCRSIGWCWPFWPDNTTQYGIHSAVRSPNWSWY